MDYLTLRDNFKEFLNRTDCSETRADLFITLGANRTSRILRTPMQEQQIRYIIVETKDYIAIPKDYLGFIELAVDGVTVNRIVGSQVEERNGFHIKGRRMYIHPAPKGDSVVVLRYYKEFSTPIDGQEASFKPDYLSIIPDIIIYSALVFAADFFIDQRKASFNETYMSLLQEAQDLADRDLMSGGISITPYGDGYI